MKRRGTLRDWLTPILIGVVGYALLHFYTGLDKRASEGKRQIMGETGSSQPLKPKTEARIGSQEKAAHSEQKTLPPSSINQAVSGPDNTWNKQQSSEPPTVSQPLQGIKLSSAESQTNQTTSQGVEVPEPGIAPQTPTETPTRLREEERGTLASNGNTPATGNGPMIRRSAIALAVENREPSGVSGQVSVREGKVYCWIHILNGQGGKITVRWSSKGQKLAETQLSVGSNDWRTWALTALRPSMIGPAQADILNENGVLLQTLSFEITD